VASASTARFSFRLVCLVLELLVSQIVLGQATRGQSETSVSKEVSAWFRSVAIPIDSISPQSAFDDLRPLQSTIGNARIVAMGEATHGTHEFFQLKHRMLEFLVERMGFTVFGIEANWPESLAVNDYPAEALAGLYFWTWTRKKYST
jgi:erythromycin esterase